MFNLNDILVAGQGGDAVNNLARQFGITPDQAQAAIDALTPALSQGLQAKAQDQQGFGNILGLMTGSQYHAAFENPRAALSPETVGAGNDVLGELFGSKQVSRQVAAHAADMSGVSQSIIKQMLPVIASMVMGGLMKSMQNQGLGGIFDQLGKMAGQGGGLGGVLGQVFGQTGGQTPSASQSNNQTPGGLGNIFGNVLGDIMSGGHAAGGRTSGKTSPSGSAADGGLGDLLGGIFGQPQQPEPRQPPQGAQRDATTAPSATGGLDPAMVQAGLDALTKMFNPGTGAAKSGQQGLQDILGQILQGNRR